ncbi:hypothetical protein [Actinospica robiniae]|uniref:hypothetical protein n=1 Tax=Actinospica robiniae TaxID=304901 RepID=UPI000558F33E|nr:hypothetical protein [Actinospica robiniae]
MDDEGQHPDPAIATIHGLAPTSHSQLRRLVKPDVAFLFDWSPNASMIAASDAVAELIETMDLSVAEPFAADDAALAELALRTPTPGRMSRPGAFDVRRLTQCSRSLPCFGTAWLWFFSTAAPRFSSAVVQSPSADGMKAPGTSLGA